MSVYLHHFLSLRLRLEAYRGNAGEHPVRNRAERENTPSIRLLVFDFSSIIIGLGVNILRSTGSNNFLFLSIVLRSITYPFLFHVAMPQNPSAPTTIQQPFSRKDYFELRVEKFSVNIIPFFFGIVNQFVHIDVIHQHIFNLLSCVAADVNCIAYGVCSLFYVHI